MLNLHILAWYILFHHYCSSYTPYTNTSLLPYTPIMILYKVAPSYNWFINPINYSYILVHQDINQLSYLQCGARQF